ncbi:hypothetical protein [Chitinophaga sp. sic0106]|uniref:hypothetical protein n=1 Tax=Chitinophaga sp. sic0106 TaxID=2854785 RepID=UPI001C495F22|nr:hypothetical protein [Chitinophaga sp. sic0106]MBV7533911.1 hypothetical protein [Chitinophaga sp. sic0106]
MTMDLTMLENIFNSVYENAASLDAALLRLRESGATQAQSVMILIKKLKLSLPEADALVVNSCAWSDSKEITNRFRKDFGDYLESQ